MKIIHVVEKFFNSGALSSLNQIYEALKKSSFIKNQEVICLKFNSNKKEKKISSYFPDNSKVFETQQFINYLKSHGSSEAVCIFHKLMCSPTKVVSSLINQGDLPSIVINHTYSKSINFNKLYKFDACVSVSDHMKSCIEKINPKMKVFTIKNIVDFNGISKFKSFDKDEKSYVTGRINALNVIKYNDEFIKWISSLKFDKPHLHQYIGTGQFMNDATSLCASLRNSNSNTQMLGSILDEDKKFGILKSWDLFVYEINRPEGTSMSVLESLACGVPVICSNHPGNNEIIVDGINGFVFDDLNQASLIIKNLFSDQRSLGLLRQSTLEWAKNNLNNDILSKKYEEVIKWVVDNHKFRKTKTKENHVVEAQRNEKTEVIKNRFQVKYSGKVIKRNQSLDFNSLKNKTGTVVHAKSSYVAPSSIEYVKLYIPIFNSNELVKLEKVDSDFFALANCEVKELALEGKGIGSGFIIFDTNSRQFKNIELIDDMRLKNSEILISSSSEICSIKNLLLYNQLWEEKEK